MILFTNGCSWTYGGGLELDHYSQTEERLTSVWPHHLGNFLGAEKTINLATGCGSNSRILRTTFNWIQEQTPEDLNKTVAVIQWSEYSRYEYYTPYDFSNKYEDLPNGWVKAKPGLVLSSLEQDKDKVLERSESRLSTYTDIEGLYKHIAECDSLAALFKKYNIKYYYWHYGNILHESPNKIKEYLLTNHVWLDKGICDWKYDRVNLKTDFHPSISGHRQLAEIIYNKMKEEK
jgi:hypothetical protein